MAGPEIGFLFQFGTIREIVTTNASTLTLSKLKELACEFITTKIDVLQKIQNRCMKLILKLGQRTHTKDLIEMLQWMTIKQRINYNTLKFIAKIERGEAPDYMKAKLVRRDVKLNRNLRNKCSYQLPNSRKEITQNSLFYKGMQMYNDFRVSKGIVECNVSKSKIEKLISDYVKEKF